MLSDIEIEGFVESLEKLNGQVKSGRRIIIHVGYNPIQKALDVISDQGDTIEGLREDTMGDDY